MSNFLHDSQYQQAIASCSPGIVNFLKKLDEADLPGLRARAVSDGSALRVVEGVRSFESQIDCYCKGRKVDYVWVPDGLKVYPAICPDYTKITDKKKIVTYAWAGQSYHNYGLAVDIIFRDKGYDVGKADYINAGVVDFAAKCGIVWGGSWTKLVDLCHFQDESYGIPDDMPEHIDRLGKTYFYNKAWDKSASWRTLGGSANPVQSDGKINYKALAAALGVPLALLAAWLCFGRKDR